MKRTLSVLLALALIFAITVPTVAAAPATTPADQITIAIPYFQSSGLEMTLKNSPRHAAIRQDYVDEEIELLDFKIYFDADTVFSFNRDMVFGGYKFAAGTSIKPADYPQGKLGAFILVKEDNSCTFNAGPAQNMPYGSKDYDFFLIDNMYYQNNVTNEGYTALDISKWEATTTATKNYRIDADFDQDGTADYSYVIPNVSAVQKVQLADKQTTKDNAVLAVAGKEFNMFTIKQGTEIHLEGATTCYEFMLDYKDGKFTVIEPSEEYKRTHQARLTSADGKEHWERVSVGNGKTYPRWTEGTYCPFLYEGFYLYVQNPFVPQVYITNPYSDDFLKLSNERKNMLQYNAVVLEVVK